MKRWAPLGLILFAWLVIASWYATVTPYRTAGILAFQRGADGQPARIPDVGAPDERQHANYISHLIGTKSFPVLKPGSPDLGETYQSHQPPLYYLTAAIIGEPSKTTRYLNVLVGIATLIGLYCLGRTISDREEVGLAAASFGLLPGFVMLHGAITNDPLLMCFCTWTCALTVWAMRHGWTLKLALLVGLLAGFALLTKSSGLALLPALGVAWLVSGRHGEKPMATGFATLLLPLLVAGPWLMRNTSLYGDPLGLRIFKEAFVGSAQASMFTGTVGPIAYWSDWVLWWTSRSFVGAFGYMDIFLPNTLYLAVIAVVGLLVLGQLVGRSKETAVPGATIFLTTFFLVIVALFVQFNLTYFQGQARYLFPAVAAIAVALGVGAVNLSHKRPALGWSLPFVALVCLNLYVLTSVLPEAFSIRATG